MIYFPYKVISALKATSSNVPVDRRLLHIRLELTEVCNFQCKFCSTQAPNLRNELVKDGYDSAERRADLQGVLRLLEDAYREGVRAISLVSVGEPLLYPHNEKVISHALELGFALSLTSNFAAKISDTMLSYLTRFSWLRWSMNAGSKQVYVDTNAPKLASPENAYHQAIDNVARLVSMKKREKSNVVITSSFVVSSWNSDDLVQGTLLAKSLEIDGIFFRPDISVLNTTSGVENFKSQKLRRQFEESKAHETPTFGVSIEVDRTEDVSSTTANKAIGCPYTNHSIYIAANGDVYPCCYTRANRAYAYANVYKKPLQELRTLEAFLNNSALIDTDRCPPCPYRKMNDQLNVEYETHEPLQANGGTPVDYFV